jgi:hypothetical protein
LEPRPPLNLLRMLFVRAVFAPRSVLNFPTTLLLLSLA